MNINWFSFFVGMGAGILFMNLINLISAQIKYNRAKGALDASTARLERRKQEILRKIKEESK